MKLDGKCKYCKHSAVISGKEKTEVQRACLYVLDTGELRGCPAGDDCDKFEEDKRKIKVPYARRKKAE